jgi:hypothetical protein
MMDEIIEEVRRNRNDYVRKHGHSLDRIVNDLQKRQQTSGRKIVDLRKRRTKPSH